MALEQFEDVHALSDATTTTVTFWDRIVFSRDSPVAFGKPWWIPDVTSTDSPTSCMHSRGLEDGLMDGTSSSSDADPERTPGERSRYPGDCQTPDFMGWQGCWSVS